MSIPSSFSPRKQLIQIRDTPAEIESIEIIANISIAIKPSLLDSESAGMSLFILDRQQNIYRSSLTPDINSTSLPYLPKQRII